MKFNIGDRVKIKEYLEYNEKYGGVFVTDAMLKHCGKVVEIAEVNSSFDDRYILKGCENLWFHEERLEQKNESILETEKTKKKTYLEKALELLNMTEEEMNKEYHKREYTALAEEIARKFVDKCSNCIKCDDRCNICDVLNTIKYLTEKELLKDVF